jgi:hypothetical protein
LRETGVPSRVANKRSPRSGAVLEVGVEFIEELRGVVHGAALLSLGEGLTSARWPFGLRGGALERSSPRP